MPVGCSAGADRIFTPTADAVFPTSGNATICIFARYETANPQNWSAFVATGQSFEWGCWLGEYTGSGTDAIRVIPPRSSTDIDIIQSPTDGGWYFVGWSGDLTTSGTGTAYARELIGGTLQSVGANTTTGTLGNARIDVSNDDDYDERHDAGVMCLMVWGRALTTAEMRAQSYRLTPVSMRDLRGFFPLRDINNLNSVAGSQASIMTNTNGDTVAGNPEALWIPPMGADLILHDVPAAGGAGPTFAPRLALLGVN